MAAISPSSGDGEPPEDPAIVAKLKLFCSQTGNHYSETVCWKMMEPQISKFKSADSKEVAAVAIDLAKASCGRICNHFNRLRQNAQDWKLKGRYGMCSLCYSGVIESLDALRGSFETKNRQKIENALADAIERPEGCFCDNNIMKTYRNYTNVVRTAVDLLLGEYL